MALARRGLARTAPCPRRRRFRWRSSSSSSSVLAVLCGLLLLLLPAQTAPPDDDGAQQVLTCLRQDCSARPTRWADFLGALPPCLTAARVWRAQGPPRQPMTVVTQLSSDRLRQLRAQCESYLGPLAAAVYLPLLQSGGGPLSADNAGALQRATADVDRLVAVATSSGRCQLAVVLVYEVFDEAQAVALYPVNSLRNMARLLAATPLIANVDVDMLLSTTVSLALQDAATADAYMRGCDGPGRALYVLPAFETYCGNHKLVDGMAAYSKQQLAALRDRGCAGQFRGKVFPAGHESTDYGRWFNASAPYKVPYALSFEPWFISSRAATLWYDIRYRGYGKNKIVQVMASSSAGATFWVFPSGFIVHRPHAQSAARKSFLRSKMSGASLEQQRGTIYERVESLWNESLVAAKLGRYEALVDEAVTRCLATLPWWTSLRPGNSAGGQSAP